VSRLTAPLCAFAAALFLATSVHANFMTMTAGPGASPTPTQDTTTLGTLTQLGPSLWQWQGEWTLASWSMEFDFVFSPNPELVINNILFTNTTAVTQTFSVEIVMPVSVTYAQTLMTGSISGSVIDGNNASATVSTPTGDYLYTAKIDGNVVHQIVDDSFSLTASGFVGVTNSFPPVNFIDVPGPAVNSTLGLKLFFELTPGDSVAIVSSFSVIPEPASVALIAAGGGLLLVRRRTR